MRAKTFKAHLDNKELEQLDKGGRAIEGLMRKCISSIASEQGLSGVPVHDELWMQKSLYRQGYRECLQKFEKLFSEE